MPGCLYLPIEELTGPSPNVDMMADWLELDAFFSEYSFALTSELANQAGIAAEEEYSSLHEEMESGEGALIAGAISRIETRSRCLGSTYPFELTSGGDVLECVWSENAGQAAYILSLVLSNLSSLSPILDGTALHPNESEIRTLRQFFQYFATAALAAEIRGSAWSFGFPRLDGSGFLTKLEQIWMVLRDGRIGSQVGAPKQPKDGGVDVFAARPHTDRLPGFLMVTAQVATGKDARDKSPLNDFRVFRKRWFITQPETEFIPYTIVPFAIDNDQFSDDVRNWGNVLHRLRMPRRVAEAGQLFDEGQTIEGFDRLQEAARWIEEFRGRAREAA